MSTKLPKVSFWIVTACCASLASGFAASVAGNDRLAAAAWCAELLTLSSGGELRVSVVVPPVQVGQLKAPADIDVQVWGEREGGPNSARALLAKAFVHFDPQGRIGNLVVGEGETARLRRRALDEASSAEREECIAGIPRVLAQHRAQFGPDQDAAIQRLVLSRLSSTPTAIPKILELAFVRDCGHLNNRWRPLPAWRMRVQFPPSRPTWLAEEYDLSIDPFSGATVALAQSSD
jgi:hypothetical protein